MPEPASGPSPAGDSSPAQYRAWLLRCWRERGAADLDELGADLGVLVVLGDGTPPR